MADVPNSIPFSPVSSQPYTLKDLYEAKEQRRTKLAQLPINEKIEIIEELHRFGRVMIEARSTLRPALPDHPGVAVATAFAAAKKS